MTPRAIFNRWRNGENDFFHSCSWWHFYLWM